MSAQAASWNDWSASNTSREAEDDKWHVALAPNEVKIVSLEQLDDLFRLSIVDAETPVWQAGMGDWLPLRVIAGIDEEEQEEEEDPQLATRRAQPKPPTPKPPTPTRRPAPPQRRPAEMMALAATQPASFYPTPARAPAPASFYPTAVSIAPSGFAAPVASPQFNSVRPLVVSHAPAAATRGGGFGRFLVGLAVLAGASVSLYRNDVLRDAAHSAHQDALYARLEGALGGPAFDTLRTLQQSAGSQTAASLLGDDLTSTRTGSASSSPVSALAAPEPAITATTAAATATAGTPPVVSLESLTPENKAGIVSTPTPAAAPAPAPAPVAARPSAAVSHPVLAAASVSHVAPAPRPAKSAAAAATPKAEKPILAPEKPESQMSERDKLNAAIGRSMMSTPPSSKSKSKSKASEYDPLNPTL